ncbi:hypothetical protein [Paracoccus benzoatiresistens]|uniref:Uncharacterized protein n=1 Tax=Paracoccus benzoatiresistens TaxID=2997341 RepID=A0ABT4JD89_9RHOB|nr:hypothetical protein [Paracoccus sp. EF6]MCZ0964328.1 hypothetical protein [Paracoccus sp. EF6]
MFSTWKQEKATAALVEEAQALAEKLAAAKPHHVDSHAAAARFWAASYLSEGKNLYELSHWKADAVSRFAATVQARVAGLRKKREYDSSDGLVIWLHTARAVTETRVAPAVRDIWQHLMDAGPNADFMVRELIQDAGLPADKGRRVPVGFEVKE